jgi:ASC-1-like (ASCH) protein
MEHTMHLHEEPFEQIKSGRKTVEIRIFDEKRRLFQKGDTILISKRPEEIEKIRVEITDLLKFDTFAEMIDAIPINAFGYDETTDKSTLLNEIYQFYKPEEEQVFGVVAIKFQLL